jgi:hypothetical protein
MMKWTPTDVIAGIVVVGGMVLLGLHIDGTVSAAVLAVAAYYFGRRKHAESLVAKKA